MSDPRLTNDKMFWIDLETEGLDENLDGILEVGCVVTNLKLEVLKQKRWLVKPGGVGWSPKTLEVNNPFVHAMHKKSGLLHDVVAKGQHFTSIGFELLGWLHDSGLQNKTDPMCGSTVHFDRKFIKNYWPQVDARFSYRNIDVSSEKETILRYHPEWAAELDAMRTEKVKAHRAIPDILESIEEFKFYRVKRGDL